MSTATARQFKGDHGSGAPLPLYSELPPTTLPFISINIGNETMTTVDSKTIVYVLLPQLPCYAQLDN